MSYFGDLLEDENKLLSINEEDITDPHKAYDIKVFSYKVKSAPDANTKLALGQDMKRGKEAGKFEYKQKIQLDRKEGEFDLKWVATNKDYEFNGKWAPKDLNDGIETKLEADFKLTPKGDSIQWEAMAGVHTGGFDMGPVRPHFALHFDTNHQSEHKVIASENIVYEKDFNIASRQVIDVGEKKLSETQGIVQWRNQEWGQMWFRSNCMAKFMGLGWQGKINGFKTAAEIQYDLKKEKEGLGGMPMWFKLGTKFGTANGCDVALSLNAGQDLIVCQKIDMPIAKNLKISYADKVNMINIFKDPANSGYSSGFSAEFKI